MVLGNWNYRRCKQTVIDDTFNKEEVKYFIAEVYYDTDNNVVAWNDEVKVLSDSESEEKLKEELNRINRAFYKDVLDLDLIEVKLDINTDAFDPFDDYEEFDENYYEYEI